MSSIVLKCKKEVDIIINDVYKTYVDEDDIINYMGKEAICSVCGEKIYNDELMGYNQKAMEDTYKTENETHKNNVFSKNEFGISSNKIV